MKRLYKAITGTLWTVVVLWAVLMVALRLPAFQSWTAQTIASLLSERLNTSVTIGRVDLGWLNRIVVDDISIADEQGVDMLGASRAALSVDVGALLNGNISITSAQLFGLRCNLYECEVQDGGDSLRMNYQFVVDALASQDTAGGSQQVHIGSLVVRRGSVKYARRGLRPLDLSGISAHIIVPYLTADSTMVVIKKLAMKEAQGADLRGLTMTIKNNGTHTDITDMVLDLPNTSLHVERAVIDMTPRQWRAAIDVVPSEVTPGDLSFVDRQLAQLTTPVTLSGRLTAESSAAETHITADSLRLLSSDKGLDLSLERLQIDDTEEHISWQLAMSRCYISEQQAAVLSALAGGYGLNMPAVTGRVGSLRLTALSSGTYKKGHGGAYDGTAQLTAETTAGSCEVGLEASGSRLNVNATAGDVDMGRLTGEQSLGLLSADVHADAIVSDISGGLPKKIVSAQAEVNVAKLVFNSHYYNDISATAELNGEGVKAMLNINDPDCRLAAEATREGKVVTLHASLQDFSPVALHLLSAPVGSDGGRALTTDATIDGTWDGRQLFVALNSDKGDATLAWDDSLKTLTADVTAADTEYAGISFTNVAASVNGNDMTGKDVTGYYTAALQGTLTTADDQTLDVSMMGRAHLWHDNSGNFCASVDITPSQIMVNDTAWNVNPSHIECAGGRLTTVDFAIEHGAQHIAVSSRDSIVADLQDIDISYVLDLVDFRSVSFDGHASGQIVVYTTGREPMVNANLTVEDFRFEHGRMGTLEATAIWDATQGRIDITGQTDDGPDAITLIDGYVSTADNYIDLKFRPRGTHLYFLESFCGSFMRDIEARAMTGEISLVGNLNKVNLVGGALCSGSIGIGPLNTTYHMNNVEVKMVPDEIMFPGDTVSDDYGNTGIVKGALHHQSLRRLTYDIDIEAHNMLALDTKDYNGETFFGTIFASGNCAIKGRRGTIDFDIDATPAEGSFIEYNAASPASMAEQDYITWRDKTTLLLDADYADADSCGAGSLPGPSPQTSSDIRINMLINATPDLQLRVLMDQDSGDKIALNGNGMIKASYYNKGAFEMFGNYMIESGTYNLTIQNILGREFKFQNGSSIVFGGDPYNAQLSLKALYTVNSVPLSDLRVGNSFSGNNVRVDCIMDISGTPATPIVDFDMDLPTVNSDALQMVRSLINSEEEMNQQVIYLLTIGRFYVQDADDTGENKTSQTSLAMQSILSGTVSQQINRLLSSVVSLNNWSVGANISTGDEGWNNAEYEGLISGRMLNNRLLVNGQFGYRDNANATTSFIGDFDIQYLLVPNGNLAVKMYNQTNDRYFTKSSLNTQGLGIVMKKDFGSWRELFGRNKKNNNTIAPDEAQTTQDSTDE